MTRLPVLGIDPGSRNTGIALRLDDRLLGWSLAVRSGDAKLPDGHYLSYFRSECTRVLTAGGVNFRDQTAYIVGVENVQWWPQRDGKAPKNQRGLYGTSMVLGATLARWPQAVVVESGRGVAKLHALAYPEPIRPRAGGAGQDRLVHVRAAWDHSHAAEVEWKRQERWMG